MLLIVGLRVSICAELFCFLVARCWLCVCVLACLFVCLSVCLSVCFGLKSCVVVGLFGCLFVSFAC